MKPEKEVKQEAPVHEVRPVGKPEAKQLKDEISGPTQIVKGKTLVVVKKLPVKGTSAPSSLMGNIKDTSLQKEISGKKLPGGTRLVNKGHDAKIPQRIRPPMSVDDKGRSSRSFLRLGNVKGSGPIGKKGLAPTGNRVSGRIGKQPPFVASRGIFQPYAKGVSGKPVKPGSGDLGSDFSSLSTTGRAFRDVFSETQFPKNVTKLSSHGRKSIASIAKANKMLSGKSGGSAKAAWSSSDGKPGLLTRLKGKLKSIGASVGRKIAQSKIGRGVAAAYGQAKKVAGAIAKGFKMAYAAVKAVVKTVWATIKFVGKAIKFGVKAFYKTSKLIGQGVAAAGKGAVKLGKRAYELAKQGKLLTAIRNFAPGQIIVGLGWKAIKFVGKQLWKGLKKLAMKAIGFFAGLFKMAGKFVNKVGTWIGRLGGAIKDKAYRFLLKPLASMLVSVFGFVAGVVMSPINFIRHTIPALMDRVLEALSNIRQAALVLAGNVFAIFKKILTHPLTIAILIGGLLLFFLPKLLKWMSGGIGDMRKSIVPILKGLATKALDFLSGLWNILSSVGKFLFNLVEYITNPDGWIVKSVTWVIKSFLAVKDWIKKLMQVTGKDNIDILCMFLSGDMIGIALHAIGGALVKMWRWLKHVRLFRLYFGYMKSVIGAQALLLALPAVLGKSLWNAAKAIFKGNRGGILKAMFRPFKTWWKAVKGLASSVVKDFSFSASDAAKEAEYPEEDVIEAGQQTAIGVQVGINSLQMKGGLAEKNLARIDEGFQEEYKNAQSGAAFAKLKSMGRLYQKNQDQVSEYANFITKVWEKGRGNAASSQYMLKTLLESPELSQRLLSAFYYYNPDSGKVMMLRPPDYIGQFLDNIRDVVNNQDISTEDAFKKIVKAFDRANVERGIIVKKQGDIILEAVNLISTYDKAISSEEDRKKMAEYTVALWRDDGEFFKNMAPASTSFKMLAKGDAQSQNQQSVVGGEFGDEEELFELKPPKAGVKPPEALKEVDFEAPKPPPPKPQGAQVGRITLPPASKMPAPAVATTDDLKKERDLVKEWKEHQKTRATLGNTLTENELHEAGYDALTFDEWKKRYGKKGGETPPNPQMTEKQLKERQKRKEVLRQVKDIEAYENQGKNASEYGFKVTGTPSILNIPTESIRKYVYMFSPEWQRMQGASKLTDEQLLLELDSQDKEATAKVRQKAKEEEQKKQEQEKERRRQEAILDYSAKVKGGFIEVKIGEDVVAMEEAWHIHLEKRREMGNKLTENELEEMGLRNYTWAEWKRYYRKMHGLPEDGIKRIPFKGKRTERQIDWSPRKALSKEELSKFGIEVSEEGPVMIPMEKALQISNALLQGAKTVISIRDGLEVMRQGLDTET